MHEVMNLRTSMHVFFTAFSDHLLVITKKFARQQKREYLLKFLANISKLTVSGFRLWKQDYLW